jgi:hypothetical protein
VLLQQPAEAQETVFSALSDFKSHSSFISWLTMLLNTDKSGIIPKKLSKKAEERKIKF